MIELGELEKHQSEFARRNARVIAVSVENRAEAEQTQAEFPHLTVLFDPEQQLVSAAGVHHKAVSTGGRDAAAPTTILVDRQGEVRWLYRPDRHINRLSVKELLAAIDEHLAGASTGTDAAKGG